MGNAAYIARAGVAFPPPDHPGAEPIIAPNATQHQITEANRTFDRELAQHSLYHQVKEELKKQILAAVDHQYLQSLEDIDFGYADVTPYAMLNHLQTNYVTFTPQDIEDNCNSLSEPWNIDDPIETLWERINHALTVAQKANEPITEATAIRLTIAMLEKTGVFETPLDKWRDKTEADKTLANFKRHITIENKERVRKITAKAAGFHGANHLKEDKQMPADTSTGRKSPTITVDDIRMYYCWTHGLGRNKAHTSATCKNPAEGHKTDATINNMKGGNNTIATRSTTRRNNKEE
jgi:hypothetical protein